MANLANRQFALWVY